MVTMMAVTDALETEWNLCAHALEQSGGQDSEACTLPRRAQSVMVVGQAGVSVSSQSAVMCAGLRNSPCPWTFACPGPSVDGRDSTAHRAGAS